MNAGLRRVSLLLLLALLATLVVVFLWLQAMQSQNHRLADRANADAQSANVELQRYIAKTSQTAEALARSAPALRGNRAGTERLLLDTLASTPANVVHGLGLMYSPYAFSPNKQSFAPDAHRTPDGRVALTYDWNGAKYDAVSRAWYRLRLEPGTQTLVTDAYYDTNHVYLSAIHDMTDGNASLGVAEVDTTSGGIDLLLARVTGPQTLSYLTTANGHVIAFPHGHELADFSATHHPVATILDVTDADASAYIAQTSPGKRFVLRVPASGVPATLVTSIAISAVPGAPPAWIFLTALLIIWALAAAAFVATPRKSPIAVKPPIALPGATYGNGKRDLSAELNDALERDEIRVEYQPIYSMDDHYLVGFEALMRWRPRGGKDVRPSEFIPLAEHTGSMLVLDRYVAQTACRQVSEWQRSRQDLRLLINASALHFERADTLREFIDVVQQSDLQPETVNVELSESAAMSLNPEALETVRDLPDRGIRLHLDDFGTGRSSVSYLQQLNVAALKIDKRFIAAMLHDWRPMQIVKAIVTLAASLRVGVIAEGVETEEQARALVELGVTMGQGYLYAPPMPPQEAQRLL